MYFCQNSILFMFDLKKHNIWLPILFAIVTIIGMKAGYSLYKNRSAYQNNTTKEAGINFNPLGGIGRLEELIQLIDDYYVDTINGGKLADETITEMLLKLDPHSSYIPASELQMINSELEGSFDGIGIEFSILQDTIQVVAAISGGPSEALGLQAGDKIIKINDTTVAGIGIKNKDVIKKLRGPKGTKVKVSISRYENNKKLIDYEITRAPIPVHSIDAYYMIQPEIAYIKVNKFSATTYDEFMVAMNAMKSNNMQKLILDLRDNPGGYLQAATMIADELIDGDKLLVYTQGRVFPKREYKAKRKGVFESGDIVILLDSGSASASEIVSGAVQDWDRGTIIGRRSFGKGLVQEQFDLTDGSACRLTIARYYTPTGRCIQRPYIKGHSEKYYEEMVERVEKGELQNSDSIKNIDTLKYITPAGKLVFGGGGITPDVFVPIDTNRYNMDFYLARIQIPPYVYTAMGDRLEKLKKEFSLESFVATYKISDKDWKEFTKFARDKNKEITDTKLNTQKADILNQIKATLARQIWRDEAFYRVINATDDDIQAALYQLNNK